MHNVAQDNASEHIKGPLLTSTEQTDLSHGIFSILYRLRAVFVLELN